jgi:hypothetical protein
MDVPLLIFEQRASRIGSDLQVQCSFLGLAVGDVEVEDAPELN